MPRMEKKSLGEFVSAGIASSMLEQQLQEVIAAGRLLPWCSTTAQVLLTVTKQVSTGLLIYYATFQLMK